MRHSMFATGLALLSHFGVVSGGAAIQERPNFSGTWKLEHVAADPRMRFHAEPDYLLGSEMTVVQDAERLVLTQKSPRSHPALTLALDAAESSNTLPGIRGGPAVTFVSRVMWERGSLVVATKGAWEMTQRWSLTPSGHLSIQDIAPNIEVTNSTIHLLYAKARLAIGLGLLPAPPVQSPARDAGPPAIENARRERQLRAAVAAGTATIHTYLELARLASLQNRIDDTVAALTAAAGLEPAWAELPHRIALAYWEHVRRPDMTDPVVQLAYIRKAIAAEDQALMIRRDYVPALIQKYQLLKMQATLTADPGEQKVLTTEARDSLHRASQLEQKRDRDAQSRAGSPNTSPPPFAGFAEPFEQTMARMQPLRITGTIRPPRKITDVKPIYPTDAQASRVQGVVVIEVIIDESGTIANARILRSVPSLDEAALAAVSQWKYTSTLPNGAPVPVIMSVMVNFTLMEIDR